MTELARISLETGDLSEFDSTAEDGGDFSAHGDAAKVGSYGGKYVVDDTNSLYGQVDFADKTHLRVGFWFHPNSLTMADGDDFYLARDPATADFVIRFKKSGSDYKLYAGQQDDGSTWQYTGELTISDAWHWVEVEFKRATGAGANDGYVKVWLDQSSPFGSPDASKESIDDDTMDYDNAQFGACGSLDAGTEGTFYMDCYVVNDDGTEIGPVVGVPVMMRAYRQRRV